MRGRRAIIGDNCDNLSRNIGMFDLRFEVIMD